MDHLALIDRTWWSPYRCRWLGWIANVFARISNTPYVVISLELMTVNEMQPWIAAGIELRLYDVHFFDVGIFVIWNCYFCSPSLSTSNQFNVQCIQFPLALHNSAEFSIPRANLHESMTGLEFVNVFLRIEESQNECHQLTCKINDEQSLRM